jgi:hypothetical protein
MDFAGTCCKFSPNPLSGPNHVYECRGIHLFAFGVTPRHACLLWFNVYFVYSLPNFSATKWERAREQVRPVDLCKGMVIVLAVKNVTLKEQGTIIYWENYFVSTV